MIATNEVWNCWLAPPRGIFKVNIDVYVFKSVQQGSFRDVIRDDKVGWVVGFSSLEQFSNVQQVGILAILKGLMFAWLGGFTEIIVIHALSNLVNEENSHWDI